MFGRKKPVKLPKKVAEYCQSFKNPNETEDKRRKAFDQLKDCADCSPEAAMIVAEAYLSDHTHKAYKNGDLKIVKKDPQQAKTFFQKVIDNNEETNCQQRARAHYALGKLSHDEGNDYDAAHYHFLESRKLDNNQAAFVYLALYSDERDTYAINDTETYLDAKTVMTELVRINSNPASTNSLETKLITVKLLLARYSSELAKPECALTAQQKLTKQVNSLLSQLLRLADEASRTEQYDLAHQNYMYYIEALKNHLLLSTEQLNKIAKVTQKYVNNQKLNEKLDNTSCIELGRLLLTNPSAKADKKIAEQATYLLLAAQANGSTEAAALLFHHYAQDDYLKYTDLKDASTRLGMLKKQIRHCGTPLAIDIIERMARVSAYHVLRGDTAWEAEAKKYLDLACQAEETRLADYQTAENNLPSERALVKDNGFYHALRAYMAFLKTPGFDDTFERDKTFLTTSTHSKHCQLHLVMLVRYGETVASTPQLLSAMLQDIPTYEQAAKIPGGRATQLNYIADFEHVHSDYLTDPENQADTFKAWANEDALKNYLPAQLLRLEFLIETPLDELDISAKKALEDNIKNTFIHIDSLLEKCNMHLIGYKNFKRKRDHWHRQYYPEQYSVQSPSSNNTSLNMSKFDKDALDVDVDANADLFELAPVENPPVGPTNLSHPAEYDTVGDEEIYGEIEDQEDLSDPDVPVVYDTNLTRPTLMSDGEVSAFPSSDELNNDINVETYYSLTDEDRAALEQSTYAAANAADTESPYLDRSPVPLEQDASEMATNYATAQDSTRYDVPIAGPEALQNNNPHPGAVYDVDSSEYNPQQPSSEDPYDVADDSIPGNNDPNDYLGGAYDVGGSDGQFQQKPPEPLYVDETNTQFNNPDEAERKELEAAHLRKIAHAPNEPPPLPKRNKKTSASTLPPPPARRPPSGPPPPPLIKPENQQDGSAKFGVRTNTAYISFKPSADAGAKPIYAELKGPTSKPRQPLTNHYDKLNMFNKPGTNEKPLTPRRRRTLVSPKKNQVIKTTPEKDNAAETWKCATPPGPAKK